LNLAFYGAERGLVLFRKYASRYLSPYAMTREVRQRLMTRETAEEFVALLEEVVAGAKMGTGELQLREMESVDCAV
jgi:hypothetical protein